MAETTASTPRLSDDELARVLAHPLRTRVLRILNERVASPVELARELDQPLNTVAYHVRALLNAGCIELVRRRQRRGAMEHFYRATTVPIFSDEQMAGLPPSLARQVHATTLQDIFARVAAAAADDGFDDPRTHVSRTPMTLDRRGFAEVSDLLAGVLAQLSAIQADAAARLAAGAPDGDEAAPELRTEVALMHFERRPPRAP